MKITKNQIRQIIKEELGRSLNEAYGVPQMRHYEPREVEQYLPEIYKKFANAINSKELTLALEVGVGTHFYKIGDGQFKETGEISSDTGGLPANVREIEAALEMM
jgi:hypothetical protein